jgi:hypothetical protein
MLVLGINLGGAALFFCQKTKKKPRFFSQFTARLKRLRKKPAPGRKTKPQGLKPEVFSIIYGPTKVVP